MTKTIIHYGKYLIALFTGFTLLFITTVPYTSHASLYIGGIMGDITYGECTVPLPANMIDEYEERGAGSGATIGEMPIFDAVSTIKRGYTATTKSEQRWAAITWGFPLPCFEPCGLYCLEYKSTGWYLLKLGISPLV